MDALNTILTKLEEMAYTVSKCIDDVSSENLKLRLTGQQQGIAYAIELVKYAMKEENQ